MGLAFTVVSGQSVVKALWRPRHRPLVLKSPIALIKRTTRAEEELGGIQLPGFGLKHGRIEEIGWGFY